MAGFPEMTFKFTIDPILNTQKFNAILNELAKSMGALGKDIKPIDEAKLTEAFRKIDEQAKKTGTDIKTAFEKGNEGADKFGKGVEVVKEKLKNTSDLTTKAFNFAMLSQSLQAAGNSIQSLSNQFVALDTGLRNVGTLGVKNWKEFDGLMQGFIAKGADAAGVTKALYDAISAGTVKSTGGVADLAGATSFLTSSAKLAKAGLVDISVTTDALTSVLNAYGASATEAGKYSDQLFGAVKLGKTTVAELAPSLFNVVPAAKSAGISFDQVAAGLATITKAGVPTSVATTQLRQLIVEMMKPTGSLALMMQKLGISLESIKAEGLQKTMMRLNEEMEKTGKVANMVFSSVEAANAYNALQMVDNTGAKVALQDLEWLQTNAIGSVESAYAIANESIESKSKRMFGQIQAAITKAFGYISPSLISIMNVMPQVTTTLTAFAALKFLNPISGLKSLSSGMLALKSNVMSIIPTLTSGVATIGKSFHALQMTSFSGLTNGIKTISTTILSTIVPGATAGATSFSAMWTAALGPIGLVVGGIAAVTAAIFGMHTIMAQTRQKSAEDLLKEVETESNANKKKLEIANEQVKIENNKQAKLKSLGKEYNDLQEKVKSGDFVSDEQQNYTLNRQKEILAEINKIYPNLIQQGDNYADVIKKIEKAQITQDQSIIKQKSIAYEMEVTQVKIDTKKAQLGAQKAGEDITKAMKKSSQGWLDSAFEWISGSSIVEKQIIDAMDGYKQAIYKSATDEDIKSAVVNFQSAIWTDPAFKSVPEETKIQMVNSIKDMGDKQGEAVQKAMEMVKLEGGKIEDYLPKPPKESAGLFSDFFASIIEAIRPVLDIFSVLVEAVKPVWEALNGLIIITGQFLNSMMEWVGNAVWNIIITIFNKILQVMTEVYNFIKNQVIEIWNHLVIAVSNVSLWFGKLADKVPVLGTVMKSVKSVIDGVWSAIKGVVEWAEKAWNKLRQIGSSEVKKAPLAVSDKDIKNAENYDKLQKERIKNNAKEDKQIAKTYDALKNELLETKQKWDSMGAFDQKQFEVAFRKSLRAATALTKEQRKELNDILSELYATGKNVRGGGVSSKTASDKDYNDWMKLQLEVEKKKADVIRKNMNDELLVELQALKDKNAAKIREYKKDIEIYEKKLQYAKSQKEKDGFEKSIAYTKELMKLEADEYEADLKKLYSKMADKRIKAIADLTKVEIDALKQRKDAITNYLKSGAAIELDTIKELQKIESDFIQKETEQQITGIIQQMGAYKELTQSVVQYETSLKQLRENSKNHLTIGPNISKMRIEETERQLKQAQDNLNEFVKIQRSSNEQIVLLQKTLNTQLVTLKESNELEYREWQIKLLKDANEQEFEYAKLTAEKEYREKMNKSQGLISEQLKAWVEFQEKKSEIEINQIKKSSFYYKGLSNFADNFTKAFTDIKIEIDDKNLKDTDNKLKEQQTSLVNSLKNQTLAYTDFTNQLNELDKQRKEQVINTNNEIITAINNALKEAFKQTIESTKTAMQDSLKEYKSYSNAIKGIEEEEKKIKSDNSVKSMEQQIQIYAKLTELSEKKLEAEKKQQEIMRDAYAQTGMIIGATFLQIVADSKSAQKAFVMSALAGAKAMIPIMLVSILGREFIEKSLAGTITAGIMSGLLYAALSAAEAAVSRANFYKGVVNLQGPGTPTSDSIPAKLSRGESVIPASATRKNIKELQYLLNNDKNIINYYKEKEPQALKQAYMEIASAKDLLSFVPVINLMLEERKMSNGEINMLKKELQTMNEKLDLLTQINKNIEIGNYSRKSNTTVDLNVEVNDTELIKRIKRQELMSVRRS